jgi:hypothetical protein
VEKWLKARSVEKWLKARGKFTWGAKYVCFLPDGGHANDDYVKLFQRPDEMPADDWDRVAYGLVELLHETRRLTIG